MHGQFYENTVVVQYDKDLLEVWDEAKRLRCEWFNDYEKTASKPPMVIADLDVIQLDFRGTYPRRRGKGRGCAPLTIMPAHFLNRDKSAARTCTWRGARAVGRLLSRAAARHPHVSESTRLPSAVVNNDLSQAAGRSKTFEKAPPPLKYRGQISE